MGFRPTRAAFRRPSGSRPNGCGRPKPFRGPPCAFAPLQRSIRAAPHRTLRPVGSSPDASSPELSCPTARSRGGGSVRVRRVVPLRHVPRPRFGHLHRGVHHRPSRRAKRRSAHGLLPSRPDLVAAVSLSGPRPSWRFRGRPPAEAGQRPRAPSGHRSRDGAGDRPVRAHLRTSLGFLPSRAFAPDVRAFAFGRDADPRTLRRVYVSSRLGLRALRNEGIGWSVSGLPALLGFRTFRPSRRSVHRLGERAHGFTSRRRSLARSPHALCPLESDAVEDPGPSTRRRRPLGARRAASSIHQRLL